MSGVTSVWRSGRLCGPLLMATGGIHLAFGVVAGWDSVVELVTEGVGNAAGAPAAREQQRDARDEEPEPRPALAFYVSRFGPRTSETVTSGAA